MARSGDRFTHLHVNDIRVGGEIGRRIDLTIRRNLLALDIDSDFLKPFCEHKRRRDDSNWRSKYVGLGKLIEAASRFAAYEKDDRVTAFKDRLVADTIATQLPDGYIGLFREDGRMSSDYDAHESAYLIQGLISDFGYFGHAASLNAARKLGDFVMRGWHANPEADKLCRIGLDTAFLVLHLATGDQKYLDFCTGDMRLAQWDWPIEPQLHATHKIMLSHHAYRFMDRSMAQLLLDRVAPDEKLLVQAHRAVDFLTHRDGMVVTGTCSLHEKLHDSQEGRGNHAETCATAYMIRLMHRMICLEGGSCHGDIMERAIYNALFAAQSPDGRRLRYFTPFEGSRDYFDGDTYCCPNNFRRIVSELPQMVYYRFDGGLAVNLYTTSKATVQVGDGLVAAVKQETDYPNSGRVAIELCLPEPARFEVRLRIPAWCRGAAVTVDGEPINSAIKPGRFLAIERDWQRETMIELDLPMSWRLIRGRRLQAGRVAVMRGPVVFCCHEPADGALTLDPATLDGPTAGHAIRPDGMVAFASTRRGNTADAKQLVLTEFADPDGRTTYFNLLDLDAAEDDELKHADANP